MSEQPELIGHRPDQIGVIVPQRKHTGSGEKVDEDIAVDVRDKAAGGLGDGDRQMPRIGPGVGLPPSLPGQQLGRAGSGQVTTDPRGIERDGTGGQRHRAAPKQICGTQETGETTLLSAALIKTERGRQTSQYSKYSMARTSLP